MQINWKYYQVEATADDGVVLHGEIKYWAKDYSICMTQPLRIHGCGGHLQYGIAVIYVTDEPHREKIQQIDLIENAKITLLSIYQKNREHLDAQDIQRLINSGYFDENKELFEIVIKQWNTSEIDAVILEDLYFKRVRQQLKGNI